MMQWPEVSATVSDNKANSLIKQDGSTLLNTTSGLSTSGLLPGHKLTSLPMGGISMFSQNLPFCLHPLSWSREDVQLWLKRCIEEYSFTDVQVEKFSMNGKALVLLKKEDFAERAPYAGDVLYNILQKLLDTHTKSPAVSSYNGASLAESAAFMNLLLQSSPFLAAGLLPGFPSLPFTGLNPRTSLSMTPPMTNGSVSSSSQSDLRSTSPDQKHRSPSSIILPHSPKSTVEDQKVNSPASSFSLHIRPEAESQPSSTLSHQAPLTNSHHSPPRSVIKTNHLASLPGLHNVPQCKDEPLNLDISSSSRNKGDCRLLWEFISKLLKDPKYTEYIRWENPDDYTFRIVNPSQLSKLWGIQKNRTNMTYEKLSRALRYYYRMDIIEKVPGRRLTYRFMRPPHEIKRGQRGAKPGVPRKSRSTDDEAEDPLETDAMEAIESEMSDDESHAKFPSGDYQGQGLDFSQHMQPIDLVSHSRRVPLSPSTVSVKQEIVTPKSKSLSPPPPLDVYRAGVKQEQTMLDLNADNALLRSNQDS